MTESEIQFITGVCIICGISGFIFFLTLIVGNGTMTEKDRNLLENDEELKNGEMFEKHTVILACVNVISELVFFIHSAILVSLLIKEYIL